jgi:hypothetical protein
MGGSTFITDEKMNTFYLKLTKKQGVHGLSALLDLYA